MDSLSEFSMTLRYIGWNFFKLFEGFLLRQNKEQSFKNGKRKKTTCISYVIKRAQ